MNRKHTQKQIKEAHYKDLHERMAHAWKEIGFEHDMVCAWEMYQYGSKCICRKYYLKRR
jgi:hemoglobin-like flavoprotein